jgi:hypothetical protein
MVQALTDWGARWRGAVLTTLRDARWMTRARVTIYTRLLLAVTIIGVVAWIGFARGGLDREGKPLGTDFLSFWAASRLALAGHPALAYNVAAHAAAQRAAFGGAPLGYAAFFYPPLYLLVCLPLGLAPYFVALAAWLATTAGACWLAIRRLLDVQGRGLAVAMLAFPGVFSTVGHGQNAFLTTALFGLGVLSLDRRPILAGLAFGLLAFKPHLGLLLPLALIASGRWKTVAGAVITVLAFSAVTVGAFGLDVWRAFLGASALARATLERGLVGYDKMQSVFAAVRLLGGGLGIAYGLQGLAAAAAGWGVVIVARRAVGVDRGLALGATVATASLLASPFLLDYDLTLLAIPIAWMVREGRRTGFRPWEKSALFLAFVLPLVARVVAQRLGVPLGPPVVSALLVVVIRRALGVGGEAVAPERHGTVRLVG